MTGRDSRYLIAAVGSWIDAWPEGVTHEEIALASRIVLDGSLLFVTIDDTRAVAALELDPASRAVLEKARRWARTAPARARPAAAQPAAELRPVPEPSPAFWRETNPPHPEPSEPLRGETNPPHPEPSPALRRETNPPHPEPSPAFRRETNAPHPEPSEPARAGDFARAIMDPDPDPDPDRSAAAGGADVGRSARRNPFRGADPPRGANPPSATMRREPLPVTSGNRMAWSWEEPALWIVCGVALVVLVVLRLV